MQILVKRKLFSGKSIFRSCQTHRFYGKWFSETIFSQFKRSLKQFLYHFSGQGGQAGLEPWKDTSSRAYLGTINVILAAPRRIGSRSSRVISVARPLVKDSGHEPKRARMEI